MHTVNTKPNMVLGHTYKYGLSLGLSTYKHFLWGLKPKFIYISIYVYIYILYMYYFYYPPLHSLVLYLVTSVARFAKNSYF